MSRFGWTTIALDEVLALSRAPVKVERLENYPNLGLYSFGRGVFEKEPIKGVATSAPTLYRVRAGQFIYSRLFAFEGAFAVVPPEMDGWFVSNEYPAFDIDTDRVLTEFLRIAICRRAAWMEMAAMTVGMGHRRQRLHPDEFLAYTMDMPPLEDQRRIVHAVGTIDSALNAAQLLCDEAESFLSTLRESRLVTDGDWRADEGWETATLADVSDVRLGFTKGRKLVGPTRILPYLRAVNVQDGFIALDDVATIEASESDITRWALQANDVLLLEGCGSPRLVGRGWIWDGSIGLCLHQNSTLRVRVADARRLEPRFLAHALCASPARRHCYESMEQMSVAHLGLAGASAIPVPLPPLSEQQGIARELDDARTLLVASMRKTRRYRDARSAFIDAALSPGSLIGERVPAGEELATA